VVIGSQTEDLAAEAAGKALAKVARVEHPAGPLHGRRILAGFAAIFPG
jgi:hypothetical protein